MSLINDRVNNLSTQNQDLKRRRTINASPSQDANDYIIQQELNDTISTLKASIAQASALIDDINIVNKNLIVPGLVENLPSFKGERISVKMFGAKGDNVNDDTYAIQAGINYCQKGGSGLYFPPGNYKITATIIVYAGCYLYGAGYRVTYIRPVGAITAFYFYSIDNSFANAVLDVNFKDMQILGEDNASSIGFYVEGFEMGVGDYAYSYAIRLSGLWIDHMGIGVKLGFAFDIGLRDVHIDRSVSDNILLKCPIATPLHSVQTTIRFDSVYSERAGRGGTGYALNNTTNSSNFASYSCTYQNSVSSAGTPGVDVNIGGFQSSVWVDTYTENNGTSSAFLMYGCQSVTFIGGRYALHKNVWDVAGNTVGVTFIGVTTNSTQNKICTVHGSNNKNFTFIAPNFDIVGGLDFSGCNYQIIGGTDAVVHGGQRYNILNYGTSAENHFDNLGVGTPVAGVTPIDFHFDGTIRTYGTESYFGPLTNYLAIGNLGSGGAVYNDARGSLTNISMNFRTKGSGEFHFINGQIFLDQLAAGSLPLRVGSSKQIITGKIDLGVAADVAGSSLSTNTATMWDGTKLVNATSGSFTLPNTGTAGTYTKVTFDAQGRETSGGAADLSGSDVTGTIADARLAAIGTPGTYTSVTTDAKGRVTAGTNPPENPTIGNNVTGSRALGTVYQNGNPTPMFVTVTVLIAFSASVGLANAFTDSSNPPTTLAAAAENFSVTSIAIPITFIVLPNDYYKVSLITGAVTLVVWYEWV